MGLRVRRAVETCLIYFNSHLSDIEMRQARWPTDHIWSDEGTVFIQQINLKTTLWDE